MPLSKPYRDWHDFEQEALAQLSHQLRRKFKKLQIELLRNLVEQVVFNIAGESAVRGDQDVEVSAIRRLAIYPANPHVLRTRCVGVVGRDYETWLWRGEYGDRASLMYSKSSVVSMAERVSRAKAATGKSPSA